MRRGYTGSNAIDSLLLKRNIANYITGTKSRRNSHLLNQIDYINELDHVFTLYCSRFKWDLSELNVSNSYIENSLFFNNYMAFYNSSSYGWIVLPATPIGWNIYGEPVQLILNGFEKTFEVDYSVNCEDVILFADNRGNSAPFNYYSRMCGKLSDLGRACEVYANAMKSPTIIPTSFDKKKSALDFIQNINTNDPYILVDEKFFPTTEIGDKLIEQFNMPHTGEGLKAMIMYQKTLYEDMLTRLGIDVIAVRKEAQVTDDEANKNDLLCKVMLSQAYDCRQEAVKRMVEISGKNITCERIEPLERRDTEPLDDGEPEELDI